MYENAIKVCWYFLLKMWIRFFFSKAAEESMLRKTPTTNLMYFGEQRSGRLDSQMGHLTCFVGGLYVLSALTDALSSNSSVKYQMEIGEAIGKTCRESYIRTGFPWWRNFNFHFFCFFLHFSYWPWTWSISFWTSRYWSESFTRKWKILYFKAWSRWKLVLFMAKYARSHLSRMGMGCCYRTCLKNIVLILKSSSWWFTFRVLKNIAESMEVTQESKMFMQKIFFTMMFNKVFSLLKH